MSAGLVCYHPARVLINRWAKWGFVAAACQHWRCMPHGEAQAGDTRRDSADVAPGCADGTVSTVKMLGSGWSKATALTGLNLARSYLHSNGSCTALLHIQ